MFTVDTEIILYFWIKPKIYNSHIASENVEIVHFENIFDSHIDFFLSSVLWHNSMYNTFDVFLRIFDIICGLSWDMYTAECVHIWLKRPPVCARFFIETTNEEKKIHYNLFISVIFSDCWLFRADLLIEIELSQPPRCWYITSLQLIFEPLIFVFSFFLSFVKYFYLNVIFIQTKRYSKTFWTQWIFAKYFHCKTMTGNVGSGAIVWWPAKLKNV